MSIPVCEARWYHGAAPSFGMGLLCVLEQECSRNQHARESEREKPSKFAQRVKGRVPLAGCRDSVPAKEVTRMNCIAKRRVGAVTHMSRL